jgi:hypothetical protein
MSRSKRWTYAVCLLALGAGCHHAPPNVRFAPAGTDNARLRSEFALTNDERLSLTPDSIRHLTQEQIDQLYRRLSSGPMPDGPFRGDLFVPTDANGHARLSDVADPVPPLLRDVAGMQLRDLGRAFWKGKVFFRSQGILRNRIEDLAILKPVIKNTNTIQKLTFDGNTTWLLFPAKVSCGDSRLDPSQRSIVIDYSRGREVEGYRDVPDKIAGPDGLNILDEIRVIRRGLYLGRAYFGAKFALNFTLLDPTVPVSASLSPDLGRDCSESGGSTQR